MQLIGLYRFHALIRLSVIEEIALTKSRDIYLAAYRHQGVINTLAETRVLLEELRVAMSQIRRRH